MTDQFDKITQNFHTTREAPMTQQRTPMNAPTATGTLLILVSILTIIPFGFGADRLLWIAAGTGGAGVILLAVGAFAPKE
ncbi:hypothetical protein [uncultured Stenotrophomonas sp.]|uniref:hypothetical protein n=1 Tax=uncultured Stenotrophomonas sp. TaxID=165438 RepID=UPI0025DE0141|nr:hypothetical protein [uncultured Stenotrophomonas sp.]